MEGHSDLFQAAVQHFQSGRITEAEEACREILSVEPNLGSAWHLLGFIAFQSGRDDIAVECLEHVIAIEPANAEAHCNLGGFLMRRAAALDKSEWHLRRAIELQPRYLAAHSNLAKLLHDQKRLREAVDAYRLTIELDSTNPALHNYLGNALAELAITDQAISAYRKAIELQPDYADAHKNLGSVLWSHGNLDGAMACFRQALAFDPTSAEAYASLGNVLYDRGDLDEAISNYRQAIALKPNLAAAYSNLGNALKSQGKLIEAIECLRRAIKLQPTLYRAHSNLVYSLYFCPDYDASTIFQEHRDWNDQHARPLAGFIRPHANDRSPSRRLRIGYVSPDFRKHAQSLFTIPLFASHDHEQFEVFRYSDTSRPDSATTRIQTMADGWRNIVGLNDHQVAELIREDQIDILVDLTMHMARGRPLLFAIKPAPIQVCWLAYPGTTGLDTMDYRLTDPYLDPPGPNDRYYSETSIRLPDTFWCYEPGESSPPVNTLPASQNGHITFGSLNNFIKVNDGVLKLWAQVLRTVDQSRLLILADRGSHRDRTRQFLEQEGVAPERIGFLGLRLRPQYLELYHDIDIGLDTLPYNGHTTSLDSFWMGVPVVTLVGETVVGRAGLSQLSNLGLTNLIANSPDEFVRLTVDLARDLERLSDLRGSLRDRIQRSPLMDAPRFARSVEAAYRTIWQRWCAS